MSSILSTRTKARVAGKAVTVPAKVARRLPSPRQTRRSMRSLETLAISAARAARVAERNSARRQRHPGRAAAGAAGVAAAAGGTALAVYLLDRQQGAKRRHEIRDRGAKALREAGRRGAREARHQAGVAKGRVAAVAPSMGATEELNDPTLARKVESEIFRAADAPKGSVDVSVEHGVVHLRGQLDSDAQIARLIEMAGRVEGVRAVENLLHTAQEPASPKPETLDSSALLDPDAARRRSES